MKKSAQYYEKILNKSITLFICMALLISLVQMPVFASEEPELNTMEVSELSGSHGAYHYNAETREESTCLIGARFGDYIERGTGWLLNNNYLMTAGHLAYHKVDRGYADHIAVYIGATGGTSKQYRLATEYHVGGDYVNNVDSYYNLGMYDDWGIVKLASPVTRTVGMLGRHTVNSASEMTGVYYTQGYPADRNLAMGKTLEEWNKWYMFRTSGTIEKDRLRFLSLVETSIDIYPGQSGSPIYSYRPGDGYCAEGIVIAQGLEMYGDGDKNFIILLNDWLQDYIYELLNG